MAPRVGTRKKIEQKGSTLGEEELTPDLSANANVEQTDKVEVGKGEANDSQAMEEVPESSEVGEEDCIIFEEVKLSILSYMITPGTEPQPIVNNSMALQSLDDETKKEKEAAGIEKRLLCVADIERMIIQVRKK